MESAPRTMMKTKMMVITRTIFFLMCFGLTEGGTPVFDLATVPWNTIRKRDTKPTRVNYAGEVIRRSGRDRSRKTANWSLTKCIKWLEQHPLTDNQEILFLKNKVQRVKTIILISQQERQDDKEHQAGQWRSPIPFMRMIMCLTQQDNIKAPFLQVQIQELSKNLMRGILT
jgi:hypothetical protein